MFEKLTGEIRITNSKYETHVPKFVNYRHYKMESINAINLIKPNVHITSIYLKDRFFSIHIDHPKYFKFMFGNLFQFTSISNGYRPAVRIFTKISRVPFRNLRSQGHNSVVYVADSYLQLDNTYQSCPLHFRHCKFIERTGLCDPPR